MDKPSAKEFESYLNTKTDIDYWWKLSEKIGKYIIEIENEKSNTILVDNVRVYKRFQIDYPEEYLLWKMGHE